MKVTAAIQNATQYYQVIYDEENSYHPDIRDLFFFFSKRVDRIEPSKELEPVSSTSSVSGIVVCPPSPFADDPVLQIYHLPSLLPPQSVTLLVCSLEASPCMLAVVLYYYTIKLKMLLL